ncbi:MAG TPA: N-acetylmuramoyl-L-alanine amidase [Bacteroidales bacterium]|nr:N-acetylmuramoyl-L-alanine amidase [Bacteroidales bacterium]HBZ66830.1 N-acetylmuramoyl-L-alanine amidase [Bacteroidales bacterium]
MLVTLVNWPVAAQMKDGRVRRVVLDPGHGGKDPGAIGSSSREKDIALAIALKTAKYITDNFPDVSVIMTRKTDEFIELDRRASIANEAHADLFISIHCNSSKSKNPYGAETFVMGIHKSAANLEVAKQENAAILLEDNYSSRYEGYDPRSPESHIIFSLYQNSYREFSLNLATLVQDQFRVRTARFDRGVKEAGFWVLYRTAMPGILVETGFISNLAEEKYLRSPAGQVEVAATIFKAFKQYKANVEKNSITGIDPMPVQAIETNDESVGLVSTASSFESNAIRDTMGVNPPVTGYTESGNRKDVDSELVGQSKQVVPDLVYRVQVLASPSALDYTDSRFRELTHMYSYKHGGMFKYTSGAFGTREEAEKYCIILKRKGLSDSFVVVLYQDRRITNEQAQVLIDAVRQTEGQ